MNPAAIKFCKKILPDASFKLELFNYDDFYDLTHPILFLFDIEGGEFEIFIRLRELNPMHEFIIEVHSFGKNADKSIHIFNSKDFDIIEKPFKEIKETQSKKDIWCFGNIFYVMN